MLQSVHQATMPWKASQPRAFSIDTVISVEFTYLSFEVNSFLFESLDLCCNVHHVKEPLIVFSN